jgi:hypothetical protein
MLAGKLFRFVRHIPADGVDDAQMVVIDRARIARGANGHAQCPVSFRQTDENAVA